jgi:phosphohistidine phosphatase
MKSLLILRHAKSSWSQAGLADFERPLNDRGKADAPRVGRLIRRQGVMPDLIISSAARRAIATAERVAQAAGCEASLEVSTSLYHGGPEAYLEALRQVAGDPQRIMVVGHNPVLEELGERLTGRGETMPTAALAQVELPIDSWSELSEETPGRLINFWEPRQLAD